MRQSPKDLLRDRREDEAAVLAWISEATVSELQEFIRLAAKNGLTMGYILSAQMALDAKHAEPHWSVTPNFWITLIACIAALVAAWFAWQAGQR
jgi:hypothetical protein